MTERIVMEEYGGTMEHPHFTIVEWGRGEGETLAEVVRDILSKHPTKTGGQVIFHDDGRVSDWCMTLFLLENKRPPSL